MIAFLNSRILKIYLAFGIIAVAMLALGCDDPKYALPPYYSYSIHLSGMEDFTTGTGAAHVLVPTPEHAGKPILPFNDTLRQNIYHATYYLENDQVSLNDYGIRSVRSLSVDATPYGLMLDIDANQTDYNERYVTSTPSPYPNVTLDRNGYYRFNKTEWAFDDLSIHIRDMLGGSAKTNDTVNALRLKPLYPEAGPVDTPYTQWIEAANASNLSYTSYVYIDPALRAKTSGGTMELYAIFDIVVGYHPYGSPGDHSVYVIKESIPSNVTGYIPVKVQYAGLFHEYNLEDKWAPK